MIRLKQPTSHPKLSGLVFALFTATALAGVDSVVTFNEVHYHPTVAQTAGEWIELKNQNSVNVDLSGWRLDGGVDYVFPAGTVLPGSGYLVVAANPASLMTQHGITGVLGPFLNSLANQGETVSLKNNNGRRMDEISYNDNPPWPMAADGSGATLAKFEELKDSETPTNWRASVEVGGTPGVYNFMPPNNGATVQINGVPGSVMRYLKMDGNPNDSSGNGVNGSLLNAPPYVAQFPPIVGSGQSIDLNGTNQNVNLPDAVHPTAYTISAWVKPDVIRAQSIVVRTDANGPTAAWSHQMRMTSTGRFEHYTFDGASKSIIGTTVAVANQWYHVTIVARNGGQMRLFVNGTEEGAPLPVGSLWAGGTRWLIGSNSANAMSFFDGKIDEIAFWHGAMDASQTGHIASGFRTPLQSALSNLALGRSVINGSGAYSNLPFNGVDGAGDFSAGNVTDGSAGDVFGSSYWLGREGITNENFVVDLGNPVEITQILLRNTHNNQYNDRGTANFRVFAASAVDGSNQPVAPAQILAGTLTTTTIPAPTPANSPIAGNSYTTSNGLTATTARYLKFEALTSSYGLNVGLNEIEVFGTALTGPSGSGRPVLPTLVINEITNDDAISFWIELFNYGTAPLTLTGYIVEATNGTSYTLPATTLAAGAYLVLDESVTGLHPLDEQKIFLYPPGKATVVDAVVVKAQKDRMRRPPNASGLPGEFLFAQNGANATPGTANSPPLQNGIVINEIMYHSRPQFQPYVENNLEWIELYNKSATAVDLGWWELSDAVSYAIPAGTTLQPGAYLCVANDVIAFAAMHPGIPVIGNFAGGLSNRGERLLLKDSLGNPADEVFYRDKEPWPIFTDGLGSSLELKNPHADNATPESWAASDESGKTAWQNFTFTATAQTPIYSPTITASGATAFHELRMGLLEEGEVLVDDVSVREITNASSIELIQNGTFVGAITPMWRILGNHDQSSVVTDAGNPVLQLRASGPLLYMHNLLETTLKTGGAVVPVVDGREYTISLRAKWLRGCPWLHTEFYYNKIAKTFLLDMPASSGTPGAQNSTYSVNLGPNFTKTIHSPAVPAASQAVTVTSLVTDANGVGAVSLKYTVNGGAFVSAPMTTTGNGKYTGTIPGQPSGTVTQFYLEATDTAAVPVVSTWPAAGANSRALIKTNEGAAVAGKQNLRVITTTADANELASQVNMMSNRRRGCTIIHNENEIFYDGKIRLRGSMYSRSNSSQAGESITFPSDRLFRGTQRTVSVRRSGINEIVVKHAINAAGGLPDNYNDIINLVSFRSDIVGPARMEMERFSNSWLDEFYPEGSDGTQFKLEGIRVPTQTLPNGSIPAGSPEGIKNLTTAGMGWVVELDLADLGADGEQYRHAFRWLNNFSRNDNARFVQLCRTLSLPTGTAAQQLAFETAIEPIMDVDGWMRTFAMMSLFGIGDVYSQPPGTVPTISNPHNLNFYMPPTPNGKIAAIPWDWNFVFSLAATAPLTGDKNIQKVISRPRFKRLFLGHLKNLIDTSFNSAYMTPWLAHYGACAGASYTSYATNITNRNNHVLSQINAQVPPVTFAITSNGGLDFSTNGATTLLTGDGWVDVREIRLNGSPQSLPVTWLDENSWQISVPLAAGANVITLAALDGRGIQVGTDSITITNTSSVTMASAANLVISEIHYHPATVMEAEFIELMNISPTLSVNIGGCSFSSGIDYTAPPDTILAPGGRFVIPESAFLNATGLNNGGERITLVQPGGTIIKNFSYSDTPPWPTSPDGGGPSLILIAPDRNPDHANPANWRPSIANGGNAGSTDAIPFTGVADGDDDLDGFTNLVEYAMGLHPQITHEMSGDTILMTLPRIPNADDAIITAQVSTALSGWVDAELFGMTEHTLIFSVPAGLVGENRLFIRGRVELRP